MCKSLRSIFILPDNYNFIPSLFTEQKSTVSSFNRITHLESRGFPAGCNYFSFGTLSEFDVLSWINTYISHSNEIVQLGAWQAKYRIKWTIIGDNTNNIMNFIIPFDSSTCHEPWDINGNDISFKGNSGEFVIPGWYQYFVIRSERRDIQIKLDIIAEDYFNSPFFSGNSSKYCLIKKNGTSKHVYTINPEGTVYNSQINRVIEPKYICCYNKV